VAEADAILAVARSLQDPLAGRFRLGIIPTLAPYLLPLIFAPLRDALPALEVEPWEDQTTVLLKRLRAHELDADLWRAMVTVVNGVDILLAPELITDNPPELNDPSPILEYARHAYDVIIIDAGNVYGDWNLNQARAAQEVLLVTTNELPALQAAQRALGYMDASRVGRWKIRLLVNRYQREVGLSREVIGTALHTEVFESIPSDYEAVQKALMEGKSVPAATAFGKALTQVVERLGVRPGESEKKSSFSSLLGMFSKTK